jgi:hypothetical protein
MFVIETEEGLNNLQQQLSQMDKIDDMLKLVNLNNVVLWK